MTPTISPFLIFQDGRAEEAMNRYTALLGGRCVSITRHTAETGGPEGQVMLGVFEILGQRVLCTDSPPVHDFNFTPAVSLFIECEDEHQLDTFADALAEEGAFLMPPGDYGFSRKFAFLTDRFGVAWQLNLPHH